MGNRLRATGYGQSAASAADTLSSGHPRRTHILLTVDRSSALPLVSGRRP
jgi:hypothetical protein